MRSFLLSPSNDFFFSIQEQTISLEAVNSWSSPKISMQKATHWSRFQVNVSWDHMVTSTTQLQNSCPSIWHGIWTGVKPGESDK